MNDIPIIQPLRRVSKYHKILYIHTLIQQRFLLYLTMRSDIFPNRLKRVSSQPQTSENDKNHWPNVSSQEQLEENLEEDLENNLLKFRQKKYAKSTIVGGSNNEWSKVPSGLRQSMRRQGQYASQIQRRSSTSYLLKQLNTNLLKQFTDQKICELCQCVSQSQLVSITDCDHRYCIDCINQYINYKISIHQLVVCPSQNCNKVLQQNSQLYKDLPKSVQEKYQLQKLWRANMNNPNVRLCPRQQCFQGLVDLLANPPVCNKCGKTFCKECELQAHQGPCQQVFQNLFLNWKRCPNCHVFIEKTEGCNHMTCPCSHQFCYICLADWQNSHYQCGMPFYLRSNYEFQPSETCWKRYLLFFVLIVLFPVVIVGYIVLILLSMAIWSILGCLCGPIALCCSMKKQYRIYTLLLFPILMIIGLLGGLIFGVYLACILLHNKVSLYMKALCRSCCCY